MPWQHQNYPQQQWRPSQQYSQQYQPYPQPYQPYSQPYQQYHQPYSPYPQPYQQYPQQQVVYPHQPQPTQQALPAPPPINPPQLQLPSNPQPPRPTQIPAQPVPNPNNRAERPAYNVDEGPSYPTLPLQNINLRSGKILHKESPVANKQEENEENENEIPIQRKQNDDIKNKQMQPLHPPPFPDRLVQTKLPMSIPQFDVLDELKNVYIKIPLLQAIKYIPIYIKAIKELCLRKPTRKRVDPQTIHVIGHLAGLMTNTISMEKYVDPSIPRVTTIINNIHIPNTLIHLGAAINVMTLETMKTLQLTNLQHTTIVLELADRSKVIPKGILEDIIVSLDSSEYPVDFLVPQPKPNLGGHPIILGRPWLATVDAFIGCRSGNMIISQGTERKKLTLYPSAQSPTLEHNLWLDDKYNDKEEVQSVFSINQIYDFQEHNNDDLVELFLSQPDVSEELRNDQYHAADELLAQNFQETCNLHSFQTTFQNIFPIHSITNTQSKTLEISPGKTLNIGTHLDSSQEEKMIQLLRKYQKAFAWDYTNMHGIHPETCTHHIYTDSNIKPVRQPQRRMNPMLQDIFREELQKLLKVNFIYPISDSQWVSPLVVVPKKNGKWRICVYYRQLNKATLKDYFPLPFIEQVLDTLAGKSSFSFLDGFSGYN